MRWRWHLACLICAALWSGPVRGDVAPVQLDSGSVALPHSALEGEPIRSSAGPAKSIDKTSGAQSTGLDYPRVLGALGIVIGLIFVLRWCGRFVFPVTGRGSSRAVEVLSRAALSPKQQVLLLRVGRRLIVVGDAGSQMNPLCEITDPDEVAALVGQLREERTVTPSKAFGSVFGRFRRNFDSAEDSSPEAPAPLQEAEEDVPVTSAREELSGLRERVRLLAEQFKAS